MMGKLFVVEFFLFHLFNKMKVLYKLCSTLSKIDLNEFCHHNREQRIR